MEDFRKRLISLLIKEGLIEKPKPKHPTRGKRMSPQNRSSVWESIRPHPNEYDESLDIGDLLTLERIEARISIPILIRDPINPIRINTLDTNRVKFQFKRVVLLDLSNLGLNEIPKEIYALKTLRNLNLSNNLFTEIPDIISRFPMLQVLNLRENKILTFPEIGITPTYRDKNYKERRYPSLIWLDIGMNKIPTLPQSIRRIPNLQVLIADQNRLTALPDSIGSLSRLQKLELDTNRITHAPECLADLRSLTTLKLQHNKLKSLTVPKNLKTLILGGNKIKNLPDLSHLWDLETLSIQSNPIRKFPQNFGNNFANMHTFLIDSMQVKVLPVSFDAYHSMKIVQLPNSSPMSIFAYISALVLVAIVLFSLK